MSKKIITEDEPFINEELYDRVNWVVDDVILHDDTFKQWEHDLTKQEQMHLSELGRICQNFTKTDFAANFLLRPYGKRLLSFSNQKYKNKNSESKIALGIFCSEIK